MKKLAVLIVIFVLLFSLIPTGSVAFAEDAIYSDVLADLQANEDFDINDYPLNQTDFSLNLLQVAEGNDNSLLVYVYQPSAGKYDVHATKVRMSVDGGQNYYDYNLTLLSRNSVFFKYKVDNYVADVSSTVRRTYDVVQIMRPADIALGDMVLDEHNNTITMVNYPVNWTFIVAYNSEDDQFSYGMERLNTVRITDKYVGQVQFGNNDFTNLFSGGVERNFMLHYIAFNIDYESDFDFYKAKVSYNKKQYYYDFLVPDMEEPVSGIRPLNDPDDPIRVELCADVSESYRGGIFGHTYTWDQIMTRDRFVSVVQNNGAFFKSDFTETGSSDIAGKEWVLCFASSEIVDAFYNYTVHGVACTNQQIRKEFVTDVSVFEVTFVENGCLVVHGVVDNYQSGDGIPDNYENYGFNEEWWANLWEELQGWLRIFLIVIGVIALCFLLYLLSPVLKLLWFIVTLPFKVIKRLVGKGKEIHSEQAPRAPSRYRYRR